MSSNINLLISEIKEKVNILDLVEKYSDVKKAGANYMCKCPFHGETKPSFCLYPDQGKYHCYGCGESGDVVDFYAKINNLQILESVSELCEKFGIDYSLLNNKDDYNKRKRCFDAHILAKNYFFESLQSNKNALEYLQKRGFSKEILDEFKIGYAPDSWDGLSKKAIKDNYSDNELVNFGLMSVSKNNKKFDTFRNRIIFPILDISGRVIAFGGRVLSDKDSPKYLNSVETEIFSKKVNLYGLYQARKHIAKKNFLFLTEGYCDVVCMHQYGLKNSCGVLGTAFTKEQAKRVASLTNNVALVFDGDKAGKKAAFKSASMLLCMGLNVKVFLMPENKDIEDFLKDGGLPKLTEKKMFVDGLDFCLSNFSNSSPKEKVAWIKSFLSNIEDLAIRSDYIVKIKSDYNLDFSDFHSSFKFQKNVSPQKNDVTVRDIEFMQALLYSDDFVHIFNKYNGFTMLNSDLAKSLVRKMFVEKNMTSVTREEYSLLNNTVGDSVNPETYIGELKMLLKKEYFKEQRNKLKEKLSIAQKNSDNQMVFSILGEMQSMPLY